MPWPDASVARSSGGDAGASWASSLPAPTGGALGGPKQRVTPVARYLDAVTRGMRARRGAWQVSGERTRPAGSPRSPSGRGAAGDGPWPGGSCSDPQMPPCRPSAPASLSRAVTIRGRACLPTHGGEFSRSDSKTCLLQFSVAGEPPPSSKPAAVPLSRVLPLTAQAQGPPSRKGGGSSRGVPSSPSLAGGPGGCLCALGSCCLETSPTPGGVLGGLLGTALLFLSHWAPLPRRPPRPPAERCPLLSPLGRCRSQAFSGKELPLQEL